MTKHFRSNGKLMITGEYLALHGATTLAVPLKFGQELHIEEVAHPLVYWRTLFKGNIIFHAVFETERFEILETNETSRAEWIKQVFKAIKEQKLEFITKSGAEVTSTIDLPMNYGWGSSSSLIVNLCKWAQVDPFKVNIKIGGGSGYDIACAQSNKPLLYNNINNTPTTKLLNYSPAFERNMWFIYQENKMNTADAIRYFKNKSPKKSDIQRINGIANEWIEAKSIQTVMELMVEHENILSKILKNPPIKEQFPDFNGEIKSLGAWGGDFMLAVSNMSGAEVIEYFVEKNRPTMFNWTEVVQSKEINILKKQ